MSALLVATLAVMVVNLAIQAYLLRRAVQTDRRARLGVGPLAKEAS